MARRYETRDSPPRWPRNPRSGRYLGLEMVAPAGGHFAVQLQNGGPPFGWNFCKPDRTPIASLDGRLSAGGAHVSHPLRSVTQHRDKKALAVVCHGNQDVRAQPAARATPDSRPGV